VRFLADENVEQPVVDVLRTAGQDVLCVGDVAPGASDSYVFHLASSENRLILTNDKDFGELAYREGRAAAGIVLLRLGSADGAGKAARLAAVFPSVAARLTGRFVVISDHGIRLRPLLSARGDAQ
jgi:predicted nuclease of predicted toxin-antitoxin system